MILINENIAIAGIIANTEEDFSESHSHHNYWTKNADKHWWNKKAYPEYALSEIQTAKINNIRVWNKEKIIPIQNNLVKLRKAFDNLEVNMKTGLKKLRPYRVKIWNLEDEILEINKKTEQQIKKMLNNVQLGFFNSGGYDWWNIVDSCWSSAHDKLLNRNQRMLMSNRGFSW